MGEQVAPRTVAGAIADYLAAQGIERVYTLPGSHMKPIWAELDRLGVRIVTARHEGAAVHMAQAEADLKHGLAAAIVTTGPGLTNAVTALATAYLAESPVLLISTRPPDEQAGMGALEEVDQAALVSPVCRAVEVVRSARHVVDRLDRAVSAALGDDGPSGPAYVEFDSGTLRDTAAPTYTAYPRRERARRLPDPAAIDTAARLIAASRRPLVIAGREVLEAPEALRTFVAQTGALYLDTRASRDALSESIPSYVPAARARAMAEADLVITLGRRLDFEVAYGSPAVFTSAGAFVRMGRNSAEVQGNRRGDAEVRADAWSALDALIASGTAPARLDTEWRDEVVAENAAKRVRLADSLAAGAFTAPDALHPYEVVRALNERIDDDAIVIVDGGDTLSWSRAALKAPTYLDLGAFGCLGVGVPYAVGASLAHPGRPVVLLTGDGALGFHAMELETAVREGARITVVVANNSAWNIERADQVLRYDGHVLGTELGTVAFDQIARAVGAVGLRADTAEELASALDRALAGPTALVDVRVSREPVSPDTRSGLALVPEFHAVAAWDAAERAWLKAEGGSE